MISFMDCAFSVVSKKSLPGTSLVVQWLRLHASNARSTGSIPGQGTKIPHATRCGQKTKKTNEESTEVQWTEKEMGKKSEKL